MQLNAKKYRMFVVGVGEEVKANEKVLDAIAYYGNPLGMAGASPDNIPQHPSKDHWYFPASDSKSIAKAFEDITNDNISCVYTVDWDKVPTYDDALKQNVLHQCDMVRPAGVPKNGGDNVGLTYIPNCKDEGNKLGWNWKELPGASTDKLKEIGPDVKQCTQIQLCPNACDKLKIHNGKKEWETLSASFGCFVIIIG
jgi:hypothetical protein